MKVIQMRRNDIQSLFRDPVSNSVNRGRKTERELPSEYAATPSPSPERLTHRGYRAPIPNDNFTPPYPTDVLPDRSIFSDNFRKNHLMSINPHYPVAPIQRVQAEALKREEERSRQIGRAGREAIPANTIIGMSPDTERYLEGYLRNPSVQQQLRQNPTIHVPFPPHNADGIPHRTIAATIPQRGPYGQLPPEIHHQPSHMIVGGQRINRDDPNSPYEVHHFQGFKKGGRIY